MLERQVAVLRRVHRMTGGAGESSSGRSGKVMARKRRAAVVWGLVYDPSQVHFPVRAIRGAFLFAGYRRAGGDSKTIDGGRVLLEIG